MDVPPDAETDVHREWLLVKLRSPWKVGGRFSVKALRPSLASSVENRIEKRSASTM